MEDRPTRVFMSVGADEAFLLSSRSALAPDLELAFLGLRLGFFVGYGKDNDKKV